MSKISHSLDPLIKDCEQVIATGFDEGDRSGVAAALIDRLRYKRAELQHELNVVLATIGKLEELNTSPKVEQSSNSSPAGKAIQEVVRDAISIFNTTKSDYPELPEALGYSMDRPVKKTHGAHH
jgi:hypothetical protein